MRSSTVVHDDTGDGAMDSIPTTEAPLLYSLADGIARLRFNRPAQLNTIDVATAEAFAAACRAIEADASVRVVVISGAGRGFGAGGELSAFTSDADRSAVAIIGPMHEGLRILTALDAPVIASLHGVVAGGTLSLALACDLAIAAVGTRFNLAYVNIGSSCDLGASYNLPRLVGLRNALQIALLGETFDAAEALRLGMINKLVPADSLVDETERMAIQFAGAATKAIGHLKRLIRDSANRDLATQFDHELDAFRNNAKNHDFQEGIASFLARRKPAFTGN
jgi:2-(1,2-epoxy-1,2-dihydrophenyl)acetyl-CoA isomerase